MPKYTIRIPEVWLQSYSIEAESEEKALDDVGIFGKLLENKFEFSHILGTELWDIKEVDINVA